MTNETIWSGDKPKKELTNYFVTKDFVKINGNAQQMTIQEAKRTS